MAAKSLTIRTEPEILEWLSALVKSVDRSRNWVIEDALKQYIEQQTRYVEWTLVMVWGDLGSKRGGMRRGSVALADDPAVPVSCVGYG